MLTFRSRGFTVAQRRNNTHAERNSVHTDTATDKDTPTHIIHIKYVTHNIYIYKIRGKHLYRIYVSIM